MCETCNSPSRRWFLLGRAGRRAVQRRPAVVLAEGLEVEIRSSWAGEESPAGDLTGEPDVRVLLVHHSASPNDYAPEDVPGILQEFWAFHTGPERGWPDIAYNFLIDRYGTIWEGRTGSLISQVRGDATGGNQGYSQLVCLIGSFETEPPTAPARDSLDRLLAWMAARAGVDPTPGARTRFVSMGSNRHPAGTEIDTATITGHRTMSLTSCPGDRFAPLVETEVAAGVAARLAEAAIRTTTTAEAELAEDPTTSSLTSVVPHEVPTTSGAVGAEAAAAVEPGRVGSTGGPLVATAVVVMAGVGGLVALRRRTGQSEDPR